MQRKKPQKLRLKRNQKTARLFYEALKGELESVQDGKLRVPGLGVFSIKTTSKEVDGETVQGRRIVLRLTDSSGRKGDSRSSTQKSDAEGEV